MRNHNANKFPWGPLPCWIIWIMMIMIETKEEVIMMLLMIINHYHPTTGTVPQYYFCLGADAFMDLMARKWKESDRILQRMQGRWLVVPRPTASSEEDHDENENEAYVAKQLATLERRWPRLTATISSWTPSHGTNSLQLPTLI
jgi:nicotinic acid mononucleotide adenylyltransferase